MDNKFQEELARILEDDPLGLLDIRQRATSSTADDRLLSAFLEINQFVEEHAREPQETNNIQERKLYSRLNNLRSDPKKAELLHAHDQFDLLSTKVVDPPQIETTDDIFATDPLGLINEKHPENIFDLRNVPKKQTMPSLVSRRKKCKDFDRFEKVFEKVHAELKNGKRTTIRFTGERQIAAEDGLAPEKFFIVDGMLVYVAGIADWEERKFGNFNARLYCIFENGTESNMLLRSLAAAMWKDKNSREVITAEQKEMWAKSQPTTDQEPTGFIYIARTLSTDEELSKLKDLHKIGFSRTAPDERIKNASQDPTFLMADAEIAAEYQTFDLNPQKLEKSLHGFFSACCLDLEIKCEDGSIHMPREWFVVPIEVIEQAIHQKLNGELASYKYDIKEQCIVAAEAVQ